MPKKRTSNTNQQKSYEKTGILFKNGYKTEDNHPDYTGKCTIEGTGYKIAGWWKYKEGKPPFLTITFTPDDIVEPIDPTKQKKVKQARKNMDDDLPKIGENDPPF